MKVQVTSIFVFCCLCWLALFYEFCFPQDFVGVEQRDFVGVEQRDYPWITDTVNELDPSHQQAGYVLDAKPKMSVW